MEKISYLLFGVFFVCGIVVFAAVSPFLDEPVVTDSLTKVSSNQEIESFLYVQTSKTGHLLVGDGNEGKLVLFSPNPKIDYFSDRPFRDAGHLTFDEFVSEVYTKNTVAPNADITYVDEDGNQQSQTLILENPLTIMDTVVYDIKLLDDSTDYSKTLNLLDNVSLFIDSGSNYCTIFIDTSINLSLDKDLTVPAYDNADNWKKIAQTISSGSGNKGGEAHYGWVHGENGGKDFDLHYNAVGYDATFKMHTHCKNETAIGKEVGSMSTEVHGKDGILFELTSSKPSVGTLDRDLGLFTIKQVYQTGFWLGVTDNSEIKPAGNFANHPTVYVNIGDGTNSVPQRSDGSLSAHTNMSTGERTIQVCDRSNENCWSTSLTLDTTTVPIVTCDYVSTSHLKCSASQDGY